MICVFCRIAGEIPKQHTNTVVQYGREIERKKLHEQCTGCDCQHRIVPLQIFEDRE